ncbi:hypothetical protein HYH03_009170 [Edaphochlamys debaryana]|uniref:Protein kinase domain-containing protein n=1 Tax=Edaphochlamys debaryana TaxID=47281 RepID=A0A836BXG1_9CHLO|nr:hypothetical protein HYH03_009170 [Edaphochlamys debaryana]|eukprot:KAG2492505.1 hypothetical protein HYH03_009170 [Edaphochlamys debaryana]
MDTETADAMARDDIYVLGTAFVTAQDADLMGIQDALGTGQRGSSRERSPSDPALSSAQTPLDQVMQVLRQSHTSSNWASSANPSGAGTAARSGAVSAVTATSGPSGGPSAGASGALLLGRGLTHSPSSDSPSPPPALAPASAARLDADVVSAAPVAATALAPRVLLPNAFISEPWVGVARAALAAPGSEAGDAPADAPAGDGAAGDGKAAGAGDGAAAGDHASSGAGPAPLQAQRRSCPAAASPSAVRHEAAVPPAHAPSPHLAPGKLAARVPVTVEVADPSLAAAAVAAAPHARRSAPASSRQGTTATTESAAATAAAERSSVQTASTSTGGHDRTSAASAVSAAVSGATPHAERMAASAAASPLPSTAGHTSSSAAALPAAATAGAPRPANTTRLAFFGQAKPSGGIAAAARRMIGALTSSSTAAAATAAAAAVPPPPAAAARSPAASAAAHASAAAPGAGSSSGNAAGWPAPGTEGSAGASSPATPLHLSSSWLAGLPQVPAGAMGPHLAPVAETAAFSGLGNKPQRPTLEPSASQLRRIWPGAQSSGPAGSATGGLDSSRGGGGGGPGARAGALASSEAYDAQRFVRGSSDAIRTAFAAVGPAAAAAAMAASVSTGGGSGARGPATAGGAPAAGAAAAAPHTRRSLSAVHEGHAALGLGGGPGFEGPLYQGGAALRQASRPEPPTGWDVSQVQLLQLLHFGSASGHVPLQHLATLRPGRLARELAGLRWIGQGGGGAVFQAQWQSAQVAVKFMVSPSPAHVDAAALEAVVSFAVGHPNVVSTYGFQLSRLTEASFAEGPLPEDSDGEEGEEDETERLARGSGARSGENATGALGGGPQDATATALYNALMMETAVDSSFGGCGTIDTLGTAGRTTEAYGTSHVPPSEAVGTPTWARTGASGPGGGMSRGGGRGQESLSRRALAQAALVGAGGPAAGVTRSGAGGQRGQGDLRPVSDGLTSTFQSDEGFGDPDGSSGARPWSVAQVLSYLKAQPGMFMTHIIMEYCDRGSLLSAIKRGIFRMDAYAEDLTSTSPTAAGTSTAASSEAGGARLTRRVVLRALLRTARDVAQGMCHLHANGIIHGDLKPGNVLLRGCRSDRRGFTALVSDFGLSKVTRGDKPVELNHWSTVTVMAPEVIQGKWLKASDVYSFGILLWQLVTGEVMPYGKCSVHQILFGVSQGTLKPEWPPGAHPALVRLGRACLATSPEARPSFEAIVKVLTKIEQHVRNELRHQHRSRQEDP